MSFLVSLILATIAATALFRIALSLRRKSALGGLRGKTVVVVGATSGIGRSAAELCASRGVSSLVLAARRVDRLSEVAQRCRDLGARSVEFRRCDVSNASDCSSVVSGLDRIDLLVLNAGVGQDFSLEETTRASADVVFGTNLFGPLWIAQASLVALGRANGRILVVSSMSAVVPRPRRAVYASSKAGVAALFENVRTEVVKDGISVTISYPGFVETELSAGLSRIGPDGRPLGKTQQATSMRRHGLPLMSAADCAFEIIGAAMARERSVVSPWWYSLIGIAFKVVPEVFEWVAVGRRKEH